MNTSDQPEGEITDLERRKRVAQWVYDTLPILNRFYLWLVDVQGEDISGNQDQDLDHSFLGMSMARNMVMTSAVTALGTTLFGRYGEGAGKDKDTINQVKKDADATSAYTMSESLWHFSRNLPENHAIVICLGEGLLPKAGETPDMGSNPLLGFGRIYARPQVAHFLEKRIHRLINDKAYDWNTFYGEVLAAGIKIWGAAVDTLENTNRFAMGAESGPITVFHLFDQPLMISQPYEGYMGTLVLPGAVTRLAEERSVLINVNTPRRMVMDAISWTYPGIRPDHVHVWTLQGSSREKRIGSLWQEWRELGVDIIDDSFVLPNGSTVFTSSGTYAPTFSVGEWRDDEGSDHVFIVDGYAASAEAVQGGTLAEMLGLSASLIVYSSKFGMPHEREKLLMRLNPRADDFRERLREVLQSEELPDEEKAQYYADLIDEAGLSGFPLDKRTLYVGDLFPQKHWDGMAFIGYMLDDPYSHEPGVRKIVDNIYEVAVRLVSPRGITRYVITLKILRDWETSRKIFNPLLDRFVAGEYYHTRAVKKSDSGRIRNELQTLCSQALEHFGSNGIRIRFSCIDDLIMPRWKKEKLREILQWYKESHPFWFEWLEISD